MRKNSKLKTKNSKLRSKNYHLRSNSSFTLIETMVVLAVLGLVLPALFAIVFLLLQQQTKVMRLHQVKKEGDFLLYSLTTTIKNRADAIYSDQGLTNIQCAKKDDSHTSPNGSNFYFKDKEGNWFNYFIDENKISSDSGYIDPPIILTSDKVMIEDFQISCQRTGIFSPPIVSLGFTISYSTSSTRSEETASLSYNNKIKLKSY